MKAHRTGGSMVFQDQTGRVVGTILIMDLGSLVAAGDLAPIFYDDGQVGTADRSGDLCLVRMNNGMVYSCPWHEFRRCALLIGSSVELGMKPQNGPTDHRCAGQVKPSVVSGPNIPRHPPVFIHQTYRRSPMPAGGVS